jgi:hypothetical protein
MPDSSPYSEYLPLRLYIPLDGIQGPLSYLGKTYYEGYEVYEHFLNAKNFLGFSQKRAELYFEKGKLTAVSIFLNVAVDDVSDVIQCIQALFDYEPKVILNETLQTIGSVIWEWRNNNFLLGITSCSKTNDLLIHYSHKEYCVLW